MKAKCKRCGSTDVQTREWYNINEGTIDINNDGYEDEDTYCCECGENTGIIFVDDNKE